MLLTPEILGTLRPDEQLRQVCADLTRRWHSGESPRAEEYLAAFPALAATAESALEVIVAEFVAREDLGQPIPHEQWFGRFPQWQQHIQEFLQLYEWMREDLDKSLPAGQGALNPCPTPELSELPKRCGHYELQEEIGRGGMGVVFRAFDFRLKRIVALKMIQPEAHTASSLTHFLTEAEIAARVDHPNIVQIYDVGEWNGWPFLALEYLDGGSLKQRLTGEPVPPRQAAELVETLARAVHHAHQRGVIHRDLKPANILFSSDGLPKISDFGLAKLLEHRTRLGKEEAVVGTLSYMAPEQAAGALGCAGVPVDIYALGVILYELLAGRPPARDQSSSPPTLDSSEAARPQARFLSRSSRDLQAICLRCLQTQPEQRYRDALALADDLRNFLTGKPVQARPIWAREQIWKWVKRRPAWAAFGVAIAAALLSVLVGSLSYNALLSDSIAEAKRHDVQTQEHARLLADLYEESRRHLYASHLTQVQSLWEGDPSRGLELLLDERACPLHLRDFTWGYFHRLCQRERLELSENGWLVRSLAYSPDGRILATGNQKDAAPHAPGRVRLWDLAAGRPLATFTDLCGPVNGVAFSPDGELLAAAAGDRDQPATRPTVKVWKRLTGLEVLALQGHAQGASAVAFSPDGRTLATAGADATVKLWNVGTGRELRMLSAAAPVTTIAFAPNGTRLAFGSTDGVVTIADVVTGRAEASLKRHAAGVYAVAFSHDGKLLATAGADKKVILWKVASRKVRTVLQGHADPVWSLAFSPDDRWLVTGSIDTTACLWDVANGQLASRLKALGAPVWSVAFAPDGKTFALGGMGFAVKVWGVDVPPPVRVWKGHAALVVAAAFAPDGQMLATAGRDATVKLWERATGRVRATLNGHTDSIWSVAFSPDGRTLATGSLDATIKLWDVANGRLKATLSVPNNGKEIVCVTFSPDGTLLATAGGDRKVHIWDVAIRQLCTTLTDYCDIPGAVAFSPDGTRLATASDPCAIKLWDTANWQEQAMLRGHSDHIQCLAFHPQGKWLASGGSDRLVKIWDLASGQERATLKGHTHQVISLAFSPDGKTLATAAGNRQYHSPAEVKLWEIKTGRLLATFPGQTAPVAFSPGGLILVTGNNNETINLLDAAATPSTIDGLILQSNPLGESR